MRQLQDTDRRTVLQAAIIAASFLAGVLSVILQHG